MIVAFWICERCEALNCFQWFNTENPLFRIVSNIFAFEPLKFVNCKIALPESLKCFYYAIQKIQWRKFVFFLPLVTRQGMDIWISEINKGIIRLARAEPLSRQQHRRSLAIVHIRFYRFLTFHLTLIPTGQAFLTFEVFLGEYKKCIFQN